MTTKFFFPVVTMPSSPCRINQRVPQASEQTVDTNQLCYRFFTDYKKKILVQTLYRNTVPVLIAQRTPSEMVLANRCRLRRSELNLKNADISTIGSLTNRNVKAEFKAVLPLYLTYFVTDDLSPIGSRAYHKQCCHNTEL